MRLAVSIAILAAALFAPAAATAAAPGIDAAVSATGSNAVAATDWPQLQAGPERLGRTKDSVAPPYRARWIWCGPQRTLRNKDSAPGWKDDLESREGVTLPLPLRANFTIAESVQPVLVGGRLFVGTMEGRAYAIAADDGATIWTGDIPGGTAATAAVAGDVVIFAGLTGTVTALDTATGKTRWSFVSKKAITGAPCVIVGRVIIADHGGNVSCLDAATGKPLWQTPLPAPVVSTPSAAGDAAHVPAEDMNMYTINIADGKVGATGKRMPIDNGRPNGMSPGPESGNLYAITVAGDYVWLRQTFRGTQVINPKTSEHRFVVAAVRHRDGGNVAADIVYADQPRDLPATYQPPLAGRTSPIVVGNTAYVAEPFAITCIEHKP